MMEPLILHLLSRCIYVRKRREINRPLLVVARSVWVMTPSHAWMNGGRTSNYSVCLASMGCNRPTAWKRRKQYINSLTCKLVESPCRSQRVMAHERLQSSLAVWCIPQSMYSWHFLSCHTLEICWDLSHVMPTARARTKRASLPKLVRDISIVKTKTRCYSDSRTYLIYMVWDQRGRVRVYSARSHVLGTSPSKSWWKTRNQLTPGVRVVLSDDLPYSSQGVPILVAQWISAYSIKTCFGGRYTHVTKKWFPYSQNDLNGWRKWYLWSERSILRPQHFWLKV